MVSPWCPCGGIRRVWAAQTEVKKSRSSPGSIRELNLPDLPAPIAAGTAGSPPAPRELRPGELRARLPVPGMGLQVEQPEEALHPQSARPNSKWDTMALGTLQPGPSDLQALVESPKGARRGWIP